MTNSIPLALQQLQGNIIKLTLRCVPCLLSPPKVEDPARARSALQLYYILLLATPISFAFLILDEDVRAGVATWIDLIGGGVGLVMIVSLLLLSRGYVTSAGCLTIISCLIAIGVSSFDYGGIRNPAILSVPVILIVSSILLGSRITVLFAVIMSVMATCLYFHERSGAFYYQPPMADTNNWLVVMILFGATTAILHLTINQTMQSERQVRRQADELHQQNQRLEQIQKVLEARTHELFKLNTDLQSEMKERARTEAALRQTQKLESIGLLAGGIAHDFNNLLTSIMNQSDLALRRLQGNEKAYRHLEKAIQSTQRAAELTRQLLAYAGKARFQVEALDLNQMIQANSGLLETVLQHNSHLQLKLAPQLPAIISDRGQLQQVLMNLVINAAESICHAQGEITVQTTAVTITDRVAPTSFIGCPPLAGDYVCLEVCDNGIGIAPDQLEKIFDPFFSTKERGSGLGLSAVLGVVRSLQGKLQVESMPHIGSVFRVYLPASSAEAIQTVPSGPQELSSVLTSEQLASNQLALVIDDDDMVREVAVDMLSSLGYPTISASSGFDGLSMFERQQNQIGMILLDVAMPGMNGTETLKRLRTISEYVPVLLCSGYSEATIPDDMLQNPATGFLTKPYSLEQLVNMMVQIRKQAHSLHV